MSGPVGVGLEDWKRKMTRHSVTRKTLNRIIMNYFIVNGYKSVAEQFIKDSGVEPAVPLESIQERTDIRKAVLRGDIPTAIEKVNDLNPEILDRDPSLFYLLKQQQLIELIREAEGPSGIGKSLEFARRELAPRAASNSDFLDEMEKVMGLLAFPDPARSAVGHLLSRAQRQRVVKELNDAILTSQCQGKDPQILSLLRRLVFKQRQLAKTAKGSFPVMKDLAMAELKVDPRAETDAGKAAAVDRKAPPVQENRQRRRRSRA